MDDFKIFGKATESSRIQALQDGPFAARVSAYNDVFRNYKYGTITNSTCTGNIDHAILVIGYGTNYWLIKNQWGPTWGDSGFAKIARTGDNDDGLCNLQKLSAYQPVNN